MEKRSLLILCAVILAAVTIVVIYQALAALLPPNQTAVARGGYVPQAPDVAVAPKTLLPVSVMAVRANADVDAIIRDLEGSIARSPDVPQAALKLMELASLCEKRGDYLKARDIYQKIVEKFPGSENVAEAMEGLGSSKVKIICSSIPTEDSFAYEIRKGDTLGRIAKEFNTTIELISKANKIKGANIKYGRKIKITKAKFSILVDKSQNILTLKSDGDIVKTYRVSTGKDGSTPVGPFKVTSRMVNPVWYEARAIVPAGSPKDILGSRWIGLSKEGYGIYGIADPRLIGASVTAGCVGMADEDINELYVMIPEGAEVAITE